MTVCPTCKTCFEKSNPHQVYCSKNCRPSNVKRLCSCGHTGVMRKTGLCSNCDMNRRRHSLPYVCTCDYCGKEFDSPRPDKRTCSDECRTGLLRDITFAWRLNHCGSVDEVLYKDRQCSRCGQSFRYNSHSEHKRKLCEKCRESKKAAIQIEVNCAYCGKTFSRRNRNMKYCCEACSKAGRHVNRRAQLSPLRRAFEDNDKNRFFKELRKRCDVLENGCWQWSGYKRDGYAYVKWGGKTFALYRLAVEMKYGASLGTQAAHHMCANTACVNPNHLQPVTAYENTAEMLARASYEARIKELEDALRAVDPDNEVLNRCPYGIEIELAA